MKHVLVMIAAVGLFGTNSFAQKMHTPCGDEDWQLISVALQSQASSGEEFRSELKSMMQEEMGPSCLNVSKLGVVGIPGAKYYSYELRSGDRFFEVNVTDGGVEQPGFRIFIKKNQ